MLRQVTTNEAIELYVFGKEVKMLKPGEVSGWGGMKPCTMEELLEGVICLVEEDQTDSVEVAPVQQEEDDQEDTEDDIQELQQQSEEDVEEKVAKSGRKRVDHGKIVALRKAGWTIEKIADELGCSRSTVFNHIIKEPDLA